LQPANGYDRGLIPVFILDFGVFAHFQSAPEWVGMLLSRFALTNCLNIDHDRPADRLGKSMSRISRYFLMAAVMAVIGNGCGTSKPVTSPVMVEAKHSHYHVHAADVAHDHTHAGGAAVGGHAHVHSHEPAEE
jgi:hypothetical protein